MVKDNKVQNKKIIYKTRCMVDVSVVEPPLSIIIEEDSMHHDTDDRLTPYIREEILRPFIEKRHELKVKGVYPLPTLSQMLKNI